MTKLLQILPTLAFLFTVHASPDSCAELFDLVTMTQHQIKLEEVNDRLDAERDLNYTQVVTNTETPLTEQQIFGNQAELTIGIDTTGNTKGHMYLIIDGVRFDGRMFWADSTTIKENWTMNNGLVIRYRQIPPEVKQALTEWIMAEGKTKTPTCVAAACKVVFKVGGFKGPGKNYWFPSTMLKYLAQNGLIAPNGTKMIPEIYTINSNIHDFWNNLPNWRTVPKFIFKVLFDPYTWKGSKKEPPEDKQ